jgi:CRP/FNR family transcriptional regulator, cyclic AMP receptor protein
MALLDGGPRSATITATTPVRAIRLPRRSFTKAIAQDPRIGLCVMGVLAARVRRIERGVSA